MVVVVFVVLGLLAGIVPCVAGSEPAVVAQSRANLTEGVVVIDGVQATTKPATPVSGQRILIEHWYRPIPHSSVSMMVTDQPAFFTLDRVVKGELSALPSVVVVDSDPKTLGPDGTRLRLYVSRVPEGAALACRLDQEPETPQCLEHAQALDAWLADERSIDEAIAQGRGPDLLHTAERLRQLHPAQAERAYHAAMAQGLVAEAGRPLAGLLRDQGHYAEAAAVVDIVWAAPGAERGADLAAERALDGALAGWDYEPAAIDLSHTHLDAPRLRNISLAGRRFDDVDWHNPRLSHVNLSGLASRSFRLDGGQIYEVSFHDAKLGADDDVANIGGRVSRALVSPSGVTSEAIPLARYLERTSDPRIAYVRSKFIRSALVITADVRDCDFTGADLRHATIGSAGLMYPGDVPSPRVEGTRFDATDMRDATVGFDLIGSSFRNANLGRAVIEARTMRDVTFAGATVAGAIISTSAFEGVDFSEARRATVASDVQAAIKGFDKQENLRFDPVMGAAWPQGATYDCATHWPRGFRPARFGLFPSERKCVGAEALDYRDIDFPNTSFNGLDLSGASFRNVTLSGRCTKTSLRNTIFRTARMTFDSVEACDFSGATFVASSIAAPLAEAKLDGATFVDTTIHAYALRRDMTDVVFFVGVPRPNSPIVMPTTTLPGARFVRTRIVCGPTSFGMGPIVPFHPGEGGPMVDALRNLRARGATIDATCEAAYPEAR